MVGEGVGLAGSNLFLLGGAVRFRRMLLMAGDGRSIARIARIINEDPYYTLGGRYNIVITESKRLDFAAGITDGAYSYISLYGDVGDSIPEEVYRWLNSLSHSNDLYVPKDPHKPHFLGWIRYKVLDDNLVVTEIQSDVLELTSNAFLRLLPSDSVQVIKRYKSRLENRYKRWQDECVDYIETVMAKHFNSNKITLDIFGGLQEGVRFRRLVNTALRHGYKEISPYVYQKAVD